MEWALPSLIIILENIIPAKASNLTANHLAAIEFINKQHELRSNVEVNLKKNHL